MFESVTLESEQSEHDLGSVLGWFCGGLLIVGVIVAAVHFYQGDRRKAFQAIVLPIAVLVWIFVVLLLVVITGPATRHAGFAFQEWAGLLTILLICGGIVVIPIFGLRFLRDLDWPAPGCWSR